jgi:hypothetical protein
MSDGGDPENPLWHKPEDLGEFELDLNEVEKELNEAEKEIRMREAEEICRAFAGSPVPDFEVVVGKINPPDSDANEVELRRLRTKLEAIELILARPEPVLRIEFGAPISLPPSSEDLVLLAEIEEAIQRVLEAKRRYREVLARMGKIDRELGSTNSPPVGKVDP